MDSFINGVIARWMDNEDLAAIGEPWLDVAPINPPATYAVYTFKPSSMRVQGFFDRTSKIERSYIEFTIYSTAGLERSLQTILHEHEDTGFDFASFSIDDGSVRVMQRITQSVYYAGTDQNQKRVYAASSLYEAIVERFVSTP